MRTLLLYLQMQAFSLLLSTASVMLTNIVLVAETFMLTKRNIKIGNLLCGTLLMALIQVLPLYSAAYFYVLGDIDEMIYNFIVFPLPVVLLLYYPIYRTIFKAPSGMVLISIEWVLMAQFLARLTFLQISSVWEAIFPPTLLTGGMYRSDIPAMMITNVLLIASYGVLKRFMTKTKHYLVLPHNYSQTNIAKRLIHSMIFLSTSYIMQVSVRIAFSLYHREQAGWISILIYFLLIVFQTFSLLDQYYKNRRLAIEWQMKETELYIKSLLRVNTEFRQVKHDFYNILQTYGGYLALPDIEGLRKYHRSVVQTTTKAGIDLDMVESLRNRMPIYTLLQIKTDMAVEYGVSIAIQRMDALAHAAMSDLDLCRILSNLLDNAVQAAAFSETKHISVICEKKDNRIHMTLTNSTAGAVDITRIFDPGFTTKANHSGQGLCSVKSIVDAHKNCSIQATYEDGRFTVHLHLGMV